MRRNLIISSGSLQALLKKDDGWIRSDIQKQFKDRYNSELLRYSRTEYTNAKNG